MNGYRFHLTCPRCGGDVEHVASGTSSGVDTRAVVRCTTPGCRQPDWVITVIARSVTALRHADNEIAGRPVWCGGANGLKEHRRRGEPACDDCLAAHARKEHRNRQRRKESA